MRTIRPDDINLACCAALTNRSTSESISYADIARRTAMIHSTLKAKGADKNTHVILTYDGAQESFIQTLSVLTYGAVAVIIPKDTDENELNEVKAAFPNTLHIDELTAEAHLEGDENCSTNISKFSPDDIILIDYKRNVSGKLSATAISMNEFTQISESIKHQYTRIRHSRTATILLANNESIDMIQVLAMLHIGAQVMFAGKNPSTGTLIRCIKKCRPHFVTITTETAEKIIRERIFPIMHTSEVMSYMSSSHARRTMYRQLRKRMMFALGGCIVNVFVVKGRFCPEVEQFLQRIEFPYSIQQSGPY